MSSATTHSPADIIRYLLVQLGLGTLPSSNGAWPIYALDEPDSPDSCITVYDTTGVLDGHSLIDGEMGIHEGIQVRVRAPTKLVARAKAITILNALAAVGLTSVTIASNVYAVYAVTPSGPALDAGVEQGTSRVLSTINAVVALRQIT